MSVRAGREVRELVNEVYNSEGWRALREEDAFTMDVLYGRHGTRLIADLDRLDLPSFVPSPSPAIDFHAHNAQVELTESLDLRISARRPVDSWRADIMEMAAGYLLSRVDCAGRVLETIRRTIVSHSVACVWLGWRPYLLPGGDGKEAEEAREAYRRAFFPFYIEVDSGDQSAFLESGGIVTLAVRKMVKPFIELVRDYDQRPREKRPLATVWEKDFGEVRFSFGVQASDLVFFNQKATFYRIDDGEHICDYVEGVGGRTLSEPVLLGEGLPNPFGQNSMSFVCGFWNPDAREPRDRYEAFIRSLALKQYNIDRSRSILTSLSASLPQRIVQLGMAEIAPLIGGKEPAEVGEYLDNVLVREHKNWTYVIGETKQFDLPVPALLEREIIEAKEEFARMVPYHMPDDVTIRNTTAGALATAVEARQRPYSSPKTSVARCIHDTLQKMFHFYREQPGSSVFNTPGVNTHEALHGVTVGSRRIAAGKPFEIGPQILGPDADWYILNVTHLDESPGARAARRMEAAERKANGSILERDWLELNGEANAAQFILERQVEKWKEMFFQALSAAALRTAELNAAAVTGVPVEQLLSVQTPESAAGGAAADGNAAPPVRQTFQVEPLDTRARLQPAGV